jgi:hypothetical protein
MRAVLTGALLAGCVKLGVGSFALITGAMAYMHIVDTSGAAIALLVAEAVAGYWLEAARRDEWSAWSRIGAALLVVCIGVEVDLAVVREHAAVDARVEQAMQDVHDRAAKDQAAAPRAAVPSVTFSGYVGPHAMENFAAGQKETAQEQEESAQKREARIEARAQEAAKLARQTDWWEFGGLVGMAVVYAVTTALAAGAVREFFEAVGVILERLLALPGAVIAWCRGRKGGAS